MGDGATYTLAISPPWLLGPYGEGWGLVMGLLKEARAEGAREAVLQRFVQLCAKDALDEHGSERQIPRAPGETLPQYRGRLAIAWDAWEKAGTPAGVLEQLAPAGIESVTLTEGASIDPSVASTWAKWYLTVGNPHPFTDPIILGPTPVGSGRLMGDGWLMGFADGTAIAYTRVIVRKWGAAHAICTGISIIDTGGTYSRRLPV